MLLKGIGRVGIVLAIVLAAAFFHGCSSNQDVKYADNTTAAQPALAATPQPTPNPDQAAGLITHFYRDMDAGTKASMDDMVTVVSRDFVRRHHDDFVTDYGFIHDPKIQVRSVRDRVVSYTMDYVYVSETNAKFLWQRSGRWTLNHGTMSGWVLDNDTWDSIHLVGIELPNQTSVVPVRDTVYDDGRHEFTYEGARFAFTANENGWRVAAVATPPPAPVYDTTAGDTTTSTDSTNTDSTTVADTTQTHFDDPQTAQAKCPSDIVVWVNTQSRVFHMPGTRWYGATENGTYECQADAFAEGDRQSRNGQ